MSKNTVHIVLEDGAYNYEIGQEEEKYIVVFTDKDDSYEEIINDRNAFESIAEIYEIDFTYDEFFSEPYKLQINGNSEDIIYYLRKNNIDNDEILLASKRDSFTINDEQEINKLVNELDNLDNIYLKVEGNTNGISINDYKYTIDYINDIVRRIKEKNLSPFEELIYLYDIVRDRYYIGEDEEKEDFTISRDLTEVIKGEKIVCLGFSEIFNTVSQKLGFNSKIQCLHNKEKNNGHARNMIHVKDDKYNLDGILVFDPTIGCKKDETNNHFNNYMFCGRPNGFFEFADEKFNNDFIDDEMNNLRYIFGKVTLNEFDINPMNLAMFSSMYENLTGKEIPMYIFNLKDNKNKEKFKQLVLEFCSLFNNDISKDNYLEALSNVRIEEYIENPNKYPLSVDKIFELSPSTIEGVNENITTKINKVLEKK